METRFGELRHRVTFQEPSGQTADGYNAVIEGIAAKIETLGGSEALRYGAQSASQLNRITVRYRTDLRPEYRIVDEHSRIMQIVNFGDPDGTQRWTQIVATELQ